MSFLVFSTFLFMIVFDIWLIAGERLVAPQHALGLPEGNRTILLQLYENLLFFTLRGVEFDVVVGGQERGLEDLVVDAVEMELRVVKKNRVR